MFSHQLEVLSFVPNPLNQWPLSFLLLPCHFPDSREPSGNQEVSCKSLILTFTTPYHHSQHYTTTILPQNHIICATLWSPVWTRWLDYFSNFGLFKLWTFVQHIANNSGQCRLKKLPYKHQNFFNLPKRQNLLKILSHWPQLQPKHQPLWSRFCN